MDFSKLKELYISEAEDHIQALNSNLLLVEKTPDDQELLNELMRSAHTIKGSSATMGFSSMAFLSHVLEDVFDYARHNLLHITPEIINVSFQAIDELDKSLDSIKTSDKEISLDSMAQRIKRMTGVATEGFGKSVRSIDGKPLVQDEAASPTPPLTPSSTPSVIPEEIKNLPSEELPVGKEGERLSSLKVPVARVDKLMNLTEELLVDKMKLEMVFGHSDDYSDPEKNFSLIQNTKSISAHLSRIISDLQFQVMQVRMVPVEQVFNRFPRMVRDLSSKQGKKIEFTMSGGEMELDRAIVDKLGEPLVHLLRNAVDHGILKEGKIQLKAVREKEFAHIIVENTGNSIDIEKIRAIALKKGIITDSEAHTYDDKKTLHLLFDPCFSSAEKVTETSGRGVGLSVVKQFTDHINGHVTIDPALPGGGCRFTLELPFSLAIIRALLVRVGKEVYAIPFTSVERSAYVPIGMIKSIADRLVSLSEVLQFSGGGQVYYGPSDTTEKPKNDNLLVVLVKRGNEMAGIVVDELVGQQEIIVKPLPSVLRNSKVFSGSSILGDGRIILILDIVSLLEEVSVKNITTGLF